MSNQEEIHQLLQKNWREKIIPNLHANEWITIFQDDKRFSTGFLAICAGCVLDGHVESLLQSENWDFNPRNAKPDVWLEYDEDNECKFEYNRYGFTWYNIEPLVFVQDFNGLRPKSIQLSEEFRLYHDLQFDSETSAYIKFDSGGNETVVVNVCDDRIVARRKELRQFVAAKSMSLVVYFEHQYFSNSTLEEVELEAAYTTEKSHDFTYRFNMFNTHSISGDYVAFSRIYGKKIIPGLPREKCGIWPYDDAEYALERFIIAVDDNDEHILGDSAPYSLRNTITKPERLQNEVERLYLTPVFFKPSVLNKYYADTDKYAVSTTHLHCGSKWVMWVSSMHPKYVRVSLGDLGRDLPPSEHKHWRAHNVAPPGTIRNLHFGDTNLHWNREAVNSAMVFQTEYERFCSDWKDRFGWELLKPLRKKEDKVRYYRLRRPLTNDLSDLHEMVVTLAILFNESINKGELKRRIVNFEPTGCDGKDKREIAILREFLDQYEFCDSREFTNYLTQLQSLRSTSVHRKGPNFEKSKEFFGLDKKLPRQVADDIFGRLTHFLRIMTILLTREANPPPSARKG